jgi:hypothetical protein
MGLRRSNECTLCRRVWKERKDDRHEGCGRSDPETLVHIQSALYSPSENDYIGVPSLVTASSSGNKDNVTRVEGMDVLDT